MGELLSSTHQQHQRRATNHCYSCGEFALVASTVGPCTAAGILGQTQLLNAPLCHLQGGKENIVHSSDLVLTFFGSATPAVN